MPDQITAPVTLPNGIVLRHAHGPEELTACFPVISQLRPPHLKGVEEWVERAPEMATDGYRVLAAWEDDQVLAIAGYRVMENLIHDHFLYRGSGDGGGRRWWRRRGPHGSCPRS